MVSPLRHSTALTTLLSTAINRSATQTDSRTTFFAADIYDENPESALEKTSGSWDIVNINMFLHMYDWDIQLRACKRILKLLVRKKGSMVIGDQTGSIQPGDCHLKPPIVPEGEEKTLLRPLELKLAFR